ncbi:MAG TPA: adenylyltransferase/cytidyltransferase family protein [Miltoncostaeaceae bacterium]|nr:adenylyltransferase/cytidyltransferase family protein [Miltoncostaeaceae bacterium]
MTREAPVALGMVHGRFQPFHTGHLEYLLAAAARCRRLAVGITNPGGFPARPEPSDPARHLPESNPFTYAERREMVEAAAAEASAGPVEVFPFPVTEPDLWGGLVPAGAVQFVRVLSPWGASKLSRFEARGYRTVVLDAPSGKRVSGEQVRAAMRSGGDWRPLVPPAVAAVIDALPADRALDRRPAA